MAGRREEEPERLAGVRLVAAEREVEPERLLEGVFPELRVRLDEPPPPLLVRREDVLELRDPGGEDVRVAMPST